jgi:hypothetical protein
MLVGNIAWMSYLEEGTIDLFWSPYCFLDLLSILPDKNLYIWALSLDLAVLKFHDTWEAPSLYFDLSALFIVL